MASEALRQIIGGAGRRAHQQKSATAAPTNCLRRRGVAGARLLLGLFTRATYSEISITRCNLSLTVHQLRRGVGIS